MNTSKLKVSDIRGTTAIKVVSKFNTIVKGAIYEFYRNHIPGVMVDGIPCITVHVDNQSDMTRLLRSQTQINFGSVLSSFPIKDAKNVDDFILIFDDTVRIDFKGEPTVYFHRWNPSKIWELVKTRYNMNIKLTILDKQGFLDALDIIPDKSIPKYVDITGKPIHEGDVICVSSGEGSRLYLDKVKKLTPYSITTDNGKVIKNHIGYKNELVVIR